MKELLYTLASEVINTMNMVEETETIDTEVVIDEVIYYVTGHGCFAYTTYVNDTYGGYQDTTTEVACEGITIDSIMALDDDGDKVAVTITTTELANEMEGLL